MALFRLTPIEAEKENAKIKGNVVPFQTKLEQAALMLIGVGNYFPDTPLLAMITTDLTLSVTQIIEYYGARWKIESGFKELKQDIGSQSSQRRNAQVVMNHLNFCMMASTITWIYADRLKADPKRRHKVKGRTSFAFSDVRRIMAEAALSEAFNRLCPKPGNSPKKSFLAVLLRMVA